LALVELLVSTENHCEFLDITEGVAQVVRASNVTSGICVVYSPHTTAGITINENADPAVLNDMVMASSNATTRSLSTQRGTRMVI